LNGGGAVKERDSGQCVKQGMMKAWRKPARGAKLRLDNKIARQKHYACYELGEMLHAVRPTPVLSIER
jgi:hypothetical protein